MDGGEGSDKGIVLVPENAVTPRGGAMATPRRRINLTTLAHVRREAASVYRDVRCGRVESSVGARLIYMLGQLKQMIVEDELRNG